MTPEMLKECRAALAHNRKMGEDNSWLAQQLACAIKIVISDRILNIAEHDAEYRKLRSSTPSSSRLPHGSALVQIKGFVYFSYQRNDGSVFVFQTNDGMSPVFSYLPGQSGTPSFLSPEANQVLAQLDPDTAAELGRRRQIWVSLMAILNTPGMTICKMERGNVLHQQRVRKLTGKAATAWTNVDLVPGAVWSDMRRDDEETGGGVALHNRRGHYAWVHSQKLTPKSEWLDENLAGPRGPGWYMWRKSTTVGSAKAGIKVQRHLAHLHGERRPDLGVMPSKETDKKRQFRLHMLSEAQRALLVMSGAVQSSTLH